jgi:hypothetical protein
MSRFFARFSPILALFFARFSPDFGTFFCPIRALLPDFCPIRGTFFARFPLPWLLVMANTRKVLDTLLKRLDTIDIFKKINVKYSIFFC